jgi:hypothetical protein
VAERQQARRHEWSPDWAPHVRGYYYDRLPDEDGIPEEAEVGASCGQCGSVFKRMCASGMMRQHIANFAIAHTHRHPFDESGRRQQG